MLLSNLLRDVGIECDVYKEIRQVTNDIVKVDEYTLFVAMHGSKFDSHVYLEKASSLGAFTISNYGMGGDIEVSNTVAIYSPLILSLHGNPQRSMTFIGITGTNGKSSVGYAVYKGLLQLGYTTCFCSTDGIYWGEDIWPTSTTTPSVEYLVEILEYCNKNSISHIVMEVSSHALAQYRLLGILFDVFVYTNLGHDHLDYHESFMQYYEAKKKGILYCKDNGVVVLSQDPLIQDLASYIPLSYIWMGRGAYTYLFEWKENGVLLRFREREFLLPLFCEFQVHNLMMAVAVLLQFDGEERVFEVLKEDLCLPGRMECVYEGEFRVFVDYAHTVEAYETLGKDLMRFAGEKWIVFGLGGERDVSKRDKIGEIVEKYFDFVVITSDNPRGENPATICDMIASGMVNLPKIIINRAEAINYAISNVSKHGIIIVAGKGNEAVMKFDGEWISFKDSDVIYQLLVKRGFIHAI